MEMNTEDSEWLERPDHPLLNNLILDLVFQNMDEKELKKCRLVCKTWNVLSIPFTRKAFLVRIHAVSIFGTSIQDFVDVFRSNELGIPFARFRLGTFCTTDGVGQEFLKLCGDTIKEIGFTGPYRLEVVRDEDNIILEDVSEILKSTPSLEVFEIPVRDLHSRSGNVVKLFPDGLENSKSSLTSLKTLTVSWQNPEERSKCCPTFLEELITAAKNISCLDIPRRSGFEVLSLIEKLGREASIKELKISMDTMSVYDDYADLLLRITAKPNGLRLKTFRYRNYSSSHDRVALHIIPLFKDTLESLDIDVPGTHCSNFIDFPKMSRLTTMSLRVLPKNFKFSLVNLNEIFPVLHKLNLSRMNGKRIHEFFPDSDSCPNMNSFQIYNNFGMTINGFSQMLDVFPNLKRLSISIKVDGAEILRQIWSQMRQLTSLEIYGPRIQTEDSLDSVLTGISAPALQEMRDVVKNLKKMTTELERREEILEIMNQHSKLPSIGNLTSNYLILSIQGILILSVLLIFLSIYD